MEAARRLKIKISCPGCSEGSLESSINTVSAFIAKAGEPNLVVDKHYICMLYVCCNRCHTFVCMFQSRSVRRNSPGKGRILMLGGGGISICKKLRNPPPTTTTMHISSNGSFSYIVPCSKFHAFALN